MTYTYAILKISKTAFDEIMARLKNVNYRHVFDNEGLTLNMNGIGLEAEILPQTSVQLREFAEYSNKASAEASTKHYNQYGEMPAKDELPMGDASSDVKESEMPHPSPTINWPSDDAAIGILYKNFLDRKGSYLEGILKGYHALKKHMEGK